MATLNTSSEGPAITRSYQSIVDASIPSGAAGASSTYGIWAVYSVQAPLASAFQQDSGKESVLRVFRTGEGELVDLVDEFSEGKIQFAFVKVRDPNTTLAKSVLIAWCGEGVPERTKGYFTSHLNAVSKILHGYHVQVTARSDNDLTPDGIIRKVADSSGSRYSGDNAPAASKGGPAPPVASKPVFTPSHVGGGAGSFNPLSSRSRQAAPQGDVDEDGWGADAPQVTRSQIQKVESAYKPTKVNMAELTSQKQEPSRFNADSSANDDRPGVVKGAYQPVGKVDIAEIRRRAKEGGSAQDDRPTAVKGSYEPVGKVDIAAIRAKAQPPGGAASPPPAMSPARTGASNRGSEPDQAERLTSMPKPRATNKFGSNAAAFGGTKAPLPGGFDKSAPSAAPVGTASKTFADEGGKTPAQIWAEKKARERGNSGAAESPKPTPIASQTSGGGSWESGYTGKKWGAVSTSKTGQAAAGGLVKQSTGEEQGQEDDTAPSNNVSSIRDRFKEAPPMGGPTRDEQEDGGRAPPPPPMDLSSKPNVGGVPIPGLPSGPIDPEAEEEHQRVPSPPAQPPRSSTPPTPEMRSSSPIRIAQPVARGSAADMEPAAERRSPMPRQSLSDAVPQEDDMEDEPQVASHDLARTAGGTAAESTFSPKLVSEAPAAGSGGRRAVAQFDYEKAEDNELELKEGEMVTNIDMVDDDWWMGENSKGESGLFPSNYVELVEDETGATTAAAPAPAQPSSPPAAAEPTGSTATAQYDYEAAEENELSFPDGAKIINVEQPDPDWWAGEYNGKTGLFPANYVTLDE